MTWLEIAGFILSVVAGIITVRLFGFRDGSWIKPISTFIGAYLISLVFLHIIPHIFHFSDSENEGASIGLGICILVGFFAQVFLEWWTSGIEHAHQGSVSRSISLGVIIGLCLHAFIEAMGLGKSETHFDVTSRHLLFLSIVFHKYPVSIAYVSALQWSPIKTWVRWGLILLFTAMAPLGLLCGMYTPLHHYSRQLSAIVVGIFLHISTTVLFESSEEHHFDLYKLLAIIVGIVLGAITVFLSH